MKLLPLIKLGVIIVILTISYFFMEESDTTIISSTAISSGGLKYENGQLSVVEKEKLQEKTIYLDHIKKSR